MKEELQKELRKTTLSELTIMMELRLQNSVTETPL
jgi:hypothetical protein